MDTFQVMWDEIGNEPEGDGSRKGCGDKGEQIGMESHAEMEPLKGELDGPWKAESHSQRPTNGTRRTGVDIGPFTKVPNALFGSGLARKIGPSAAILYCSLCEKANRDSSNTFQTKDKDLAWDTGLSPRTIRNLRGKLVENALVTLNQEPGQKYTYTLLPLQHLRWIKTKERTPRQKQRPRGLYSFSGKHEA